MADCVTTELLNTLPIKKWVLAYILKQWKVV